MPMPCDEQIVATAQDVLGLLKDVFGKHPGFRPGIHHKHILTSLRTNSNSAHAKGVLLTGSFEPTPEAASLTKAYHFNNTVPVTARFSDSTGIPVIPDNDPNASPRGFAVRFNLPEKNGRRVHTDIVGHSTPFFPVQTGKQFGEFLTAITQSPPGTASPTPVEQFVGSHPGTLAFVSAPKPFPISFATEGYYMLNAFKFIAADGKETWIRYIWEPVAGLTYLSDEEAKAKSPNYLKEELTERVGSGPIAFKLLAQIGEDGDITDDIQAYWPAERKKVELGTLTLDSFVEQDAAEQKKLAFDPIPRTEGIEPSADPILEFRAALYLMSVRERRAA